MLAKHALSQLSYAPSTRKGVQQNRMVGLGQINDHHQNMVGLGQNKLNHHHKNMVGLGGLEPPTSRLSGVRSNQAELQTHPKLALPMFYPNIYLSALYTHTLRQVVLSHGPFDKP